MAKKVMDTLDKMAQELVSEYKTKEALFGHDGVVKELQRRLLQAALEGELTGHLGYEPCERSDAENSRNGYSSKTLKTGSGELVIQVPRDRQSTFEPQLIGKRETRFDGLDEKILYFYASGQSTEDIRQQLLDIYGVEVSTSFISNVTASVLEEVRIWQSRPLDNCYPIVYLDCIVVKVRQEKQIINKAVYLALGVNLEGQKELLGMWMSENEGAKFWLGVLTELKNRGVADIFIACVDGLTGFPDAIEAVYPKAKVQLCIVHMLRNSLKYVSWKDRKALCADLKKVYGAKTLDEAELALSHFADQWDSKYPSISQSWLNHWERLTPFFAYPLEIRRAIYTTNAIESLNMTLRKVIKNKRSFPNDEAVFKLLYLAINKISKKWTMPIRDWKMAMNHFMIEHGDRISWN
jgi:putative transposase